MLGGYESSGAETATAKADTQFDLVKLFDFERRQVRNFTFCQATRRLYVSFTDNNDDWLYEWNVDTGKVIHRYELGKGYICDSVAISPDGKHLVVGCWPLSPSTLQCKTLIGDNASRQITEHLASRGTRTFCPLFAADGSRFWLDDRQQASDLTGRPIAGSAYVSAAPDKGTAWRIESTKETSETHGLYFRDLSGKDHRLTANEWHDNYCLTKDHNFVVATTWDGEVIVWRTKDVREVFRKKIADQYGYLAYDAAKNCILLGDATNNGTTFLRALIVPGERAARHVPPTPDER